MSGASDERAGSEPVRVEVSLSVLVSDPEVLRAYARRRYAACWFDHEWEPTDVAQAVLEALVISNENPSPDEYGIEIVEAEASEEQARQATPRGAIAVRPPRKGEGER
jgi:hypothetical protein